MAAASEYVKRFEMASLKGCKGLNIGILGLVGDILLGELVADIVRALQPCAPVSHSLNGTERALHAHGLPSIDDAKEFSIAIEQRPDDARTFTLLGASPLFYDNELHQLTPCWTTLLDQEVVNTITDLGSVRKKSEVLEGYRWDVLFFYPRNDLQSREFREQLECSSTLGATTEERSFVDASRELEQRRALWVVDERPGRKSLFWFPCANKSNLVLGEVG